MLVIQLLLIKKIAFKFDSLWYHQENTLSIIGNGVVVNPLALLDEIDKLKKLGLEINPKFNCLRKCNYHF